VDPEINAAAHASEQIAATIRTLNCFDITNLSLL
jgi:hypothetical protein